MSSKEWLFRKLKDENWFSHTIMFLTTILGILIALELDKGRERDDKFKKLNQYRISLDNELKANKGMLIEMKQWLQHDYVLLEVTENSIKEQGEFVIQRSKLDSIIRLDTIFNSLIPIQEELPNNRVRIGKITHTRTGNMTTDTWEALKGSDVLDELKPKELLTYTRIFHNINSFNNYYSTVLAQSDFMTQKKLIEVINNFEGFESLIENTLSKLQNERVADVQEFNIPEPRDSSLLTRKMKGRRNDL